MELALDLNKRYTYADYLSWSDIRCELIDGAVKLMAGVNIAHASVSRMLVSTFDSFFQKKPEYHIFHAPVDVILSSVGVLEKETTVVQPDIFVVSDASKIKDNVCVGAPDLIVEILSPSNQQRDWVEKYALYAHNNVTEYWIVDPMNKTVTVFNIKSSGKYGDGVMYENSSKIQSVVLGAEIVTKEIFKYLKQ